MFMFIIFIIIIYYVCQNKRQVIENILISFNWLFVSLCLVLLFKIVWKKSFVYYEFAFFVQSLINEAFFHYLHGKSVTSVEYYKKL